MQSSCSSSEPASTASRKRRRTEAERLVDDAKTMGPVKDIHRTADDNRVYPRENNWYALMQGSDVENAIQVVPHKLFRINLGNSDSDFQEFVKRCKSTKDGWGWSTTASAKGVEVRGSK
jgi:hypothetical protein